MYIFHIFTLGPEYIRIFVKTLASNIFEYFFMKISIFQIYLHIRLTRFFFFKNILIFVQTLFEILIHPWTLCALVDKGLWTGPQLSDVNVVHRVFAQTSIKNWARFWSTRVWCCGCPQGICTLVRKGLRTVLVHKGHGYSQSLYTLIHEGLCAVLVYKGLLSQLSTGKISQLSTGSSCSCPQGICALVQKGPVS